jgi:hypothetical protein
MNGGPVAHVGRRLDEQAAEVLGDETPWENLSRTFLPALVKDSFRPEESVMRELARIAVSPDGAKVVAWLRDLTDLAPYPEYFRTSDEAGIAAAKHAGRAGVGRVLALALQHGQQLLNQDKG